MYCNDHSAQASSLPATRRQAQRRLPTHFFIILITLSLVLVPAHVAANTIIVDSFSDDITPADGVCTLREAIINANHDTDTTEGDCQAGHGPDEITLSAGTYTLWLNGYGAEGGDLDIWDELAITGAGAAETIIDASDLGDRVFDIASRTTITAVTITGGHAAYQGGGISVAEADLTLNDSVVTGNHAGTKGGGIYLNTGTLTLHNTAVQYNTAADDGGGIYAGSSYSTVEVTGSTIHNNETYDQGGGVANKGGELTLLNSTVSHNTALVGGGGVYNRGEGVATIVNTAVTHNTAGAGVFASERFGGGLKNVGEETLMTIINTTISGNTAADDGAGIYNNTASMNITNATIVDNHSLSDAGGIDNFGVVHFANSIIGGNMAHNIFADCRSLYGWPLVSDGYNLVGDDSGCPITETDVTIDSDAVLEVVLGPLQDNGGGTETHALLEDSLALDAANDEVCPSTDQRGVSRPQGEHCDIGAYEAENNIQTGPIFTVNTTADVDKGFCAIDECSLREAIQVANAHDGTDTIVFAIPEVDPIVIQPLSALPTVTDPIIIDASESPATVELEGTNAGETVDGLTVTAGSSTITGLVLRNFDGHGIVLSTYGDNLIANNTITANNGAGVLIEDGTGHTLTENLIFGNSGPGIDLNGDGVTVNDAGDGDGGANDGQNFPVIIRVVPEETQLNSESTAEMVAIEGILNSTAETTFTLEFFANDACHTSGFGSGATFLGTTEVTTNQNGNASFNTAVSASLDDSAFITATATDAHGNTSEFSRCAPKSLGNDSWPRAHRLEMIPDDVSPEVLTAEIEQFIDQKGQSRWFKFHIEPGSQLIVTLTDLPANFDLTVYKDIAVEYESLLTLEDTDDLVQLTAEFAPDAFSPDAFSPDAFSPDAFSPDAFSPDAFSPDAFSPDAFSPDAFSPDAFSPDAFSPDAFSPDAFSPDAFSPDAFSPDAFSPDAFSPDAFSPDAFSSAQMRALLGVSAFNGKVSEGIILNTWENTGDFYIRVRGRNGAASLENAFHLAVTLATGTCNSISSALPATSHTAVAGGYRTIILTDMNRVVGDGNDIADLSDRLATLAARPEVNGVIVDVGTDDRVAAANLQADANPSCPFAKNLVAYAIKDIVDAYRELNPLDYVVIVGNDETIPFFRHPDQALLANERNFVPPVKDATPSQASLKLGYILGQDRYGAAIEISTGSDTLPIPDLAVGRLVETPTDMIGVIDAYLSTSDGVVDTPTSSLVSGYDFLEDAANAVTAELEAGLGTTADTLILPRDISPADPQAWTADDLSAALLGSRHDLIFLAGHFSANSALAADYTTRVLATEVAASTVDLSNVVVFSAGCHSGYNIVNEHGVPGVTLQPDWAQAFAQKQATLIAGTGYQYGDTDFIEYSERLYLEFSRELRAGTGPVSIGQALVAAKQSYLADTPELRPLHEKALLESAIFGLPMLSVDMPAGRGGASIEASMMSGTGTTPFTTNPGQTLGLEFADVTILPTLTTHEVPLTIIASNGMTGTVTATYLSGAQGVLSNTAEPTLPLEIRNADVPGMVLRGVGFRGGSYTDLLDVLPLTGAATTEIRGVHPPFLSDTFYPVTLWGVNYFDELAHGIGGRVRLAVTPAQYQSSSPTSLTGTMRQFDETAFRLYYSDYIATSEISGNAPAQAAPPDISNVSAEFTSEDVTFSARVVGDPAAGIQEVWVTYTAPSGTFAGQWQSLDLSQDTADTTLWQGTLDLNGTPVDELQYIVQAVNGVGLVNMATNLGAYFTAQTGQTLPDPDATSVTFQSPPTSGAYGTTVDVTAVLTSDGTPLAGQLLVFGLGPQQRMAVTDENGQATATLSLLGLPGTDNLKVLFGGTAAYLPSFSTSAFTITKQATTLTLEPVDATALAGQNSGVVATITDAGGRPFAEKTVFFIISGDKGELVVPVITDYAGRAPLGVVSLPAGTYTVDAYFSGIIPLPNQTLNLEDDRYLPSSASGTLTIIAPQLYVSTYADGWVDDIAFANEDILAFNLGTGTWSMLFDGSDVGLAGNDVDAFTLLDDGTLLMSFSIPGHVGELGKIDDSDIVRFVPDSLGEETAGTFEFFFDGSDVDLRQPGEDIDAIAIAPDGRLLISTLGNFNISGIEGRDDDLVAFAADSLGKATSGTWELYLDGSDVSLENWREDIKGVWVDPDSGEIYLNTLSTYMVPGLIGDGDDIIICAPDSLGMESACTFSFFWDGEEHGLGYELIDAIALEK